MIRKIIVLIILFFYCSSGSFEKGRAAMRPQRVAAATDKNKLLKNKIKKIDLSELSFRKLLIRKIIKIYVCFF